MLPTNDELIDIIIPTKNRGQLISTTIESILQSTHTRFNLWIVDQSTDDRTEIHVRRFQEADDRVRYIRHRQTGSNRGRNEGVHASQAPYILFVDDDCRVSPEWAAEMLTELRQEQVWATFGRVIDDDTFTPDLPDDLIPVSPAIQIAIKDTPRRIVFDETKKLRQDFGHGANMGVKRRPFLEIGEFDSLLSNGAPLRSWGERDYGYRVIRAGGHVTYNPKALLYHRHWRDWRSVQKAFRNYGFGTGAAVSKYIRCGDWDSLYILFQWVLDQGVRAILSGIFKWRSMQKIRIGVMQIVQPFNGFLKGLRFPINADKVIFVELDS